MAIFLWPAVKGTSIAFNPLAGDILRFDDLAISAASVVAEESSGNTLLTYDGETVTLLATSLYALTSTNVTFADSLLIVGDDTTAEVEDPLGNALIGGASDDQLIGGGGEDTLSGGGGNDVIHGGGGNDTIASGAGANFVAAGSGNDSIVGGNGNDTLNGGTGNDTMAGGLGNDTYVRNAAGDVVTELASQGNDLVRSAVTYTLGANLERLTLTGAGNINGTGNTLANVVTGNNLLTGAGGADTAPEARALVQRAEALRFAGRRLKAIEILELARNSAEAGADRALTAAVYGALGKAYILAGCREETQVFLARSLEGARVACETAVEAAALNDLGNLAAIEGRVADVVQHYERSLDAARRAKRSRARRPTSPGCGFPIRTRVVCLPPLPRRSMNWAASRSAMRLLWPCYRSGKHSSGSTRSPATRRCPGAPSEPSSATWAWPATRAADQTCGQQNPMYHLTN